MKTISFKDLPIGAKFIIVDKGIVLSQWFQEMIGEPSDAKYLFIKTEWGGASSLARTERSQHFSYFGLLKYQNVEVVQIIG